MNPGEYLQPFPRKITVNVPVVSGYVTSRLQADDSIAPVISGDDTRVMVTFENLGNTAVGVKLRQTNDRSISGTRIDVISGINLVAGGRMTQTSTAPFQKYLELYCYSGGPTNIRMQIESQRQWAELGFDKVADQTFYPPSLWQASTAYPAATTLPSAVTPQYNYP
jgi:hypothetical protein